MAQSCVRKGTLRCIYEYAHDAVDLPTIPNLGVGGQTPTLEDTRHSSSYSSGLSSSPTSIPPATPLPRYSSTTSSSTASSTASSSRVIYRPDYPEPKIERGFASWCPETNRLLIINSLTGKEYSGLGARGMGYFLYTCRATRDPRPAEQRREPLFLRGPAVPILAFQSVIVNTEIECCKFRELSPSGLLFDPTHLRLRPEAALNDDEGQSLTYVVESVFKHPADNSDPLVCKESQYLVYLDKISGSSNDCSSENWYCNSNTSNNSPRDIHNDGNGSRSSSNSNAASNSLDSVSGTGLPSAQYADGEIRNKKCLSFFDSSGRQFLIELPSYPTGSGNFIRKTGGAGAIIKGYQINRRDSPPTSSLLPSSSSLTFSSDFSSSYSSSYSSFSFSSSPSSSCLGPAVALKIVSLASLPEKQGGRPKEFCEDRVREVAAMQYVMRKIGELIITEPNADKRGWLREGSNYLIKIVDCITDEHSLYIIMEFIEGQELLNHSDLFKFRNIKIMSSVWAKLVCAVFALHSCGVCHRDISLENAILEVQHDKGSTIYKPVLIDYGLSQLIPRDPLNPASYCKVSPDGERGKYYYHPMETTGESVWKPLNGFACDMWQLGIMLLIMVTGVPPFPHSDKEDEQYELKRRKWEFYLNVKEEKYHLIWSRGTEAPVVFDIFKRLVKKGGDTRFTALELLQHLKTL